MSRASSAVIGLFATIIRLGGTFSPSVAVAQTPVAVEAIAATPADQAAAAASAERSTYGPILTKDPEVRAEIKSLYEERHQVMSDLESQIQALYAEVADVTDRHVRVEKVQELATLKQSLEPRNIEFELQIARLNGDEGRAADFELALDQILHPENYRPVIQVDPALKSQRLRAVGLEGGAGR